MGLLQIFAPLTSEQEPSLQKIEIASSFQLPGFHIVGLPSPEVAEAKERIRAALESSDFELPKRRIVFNLSPASVKKRGTGLDLAMALSVLSLRLAEDHEFLDVAAWGELGLDGSVKSAGQPTRVLFACWEANIKYLLISFKQLTELRVSLRWIQNSKRFDTPAPLLIPVNTLTEAWQILQKLVSEPGVNFLTPEPPLTADDSNPKSSPELLSLSPSLERLIGIAAMGRHHLILLGAKGVGKSHALEWLIRLQPECSDLVKVHRALLAELIGPARIDDSNVRRVSSSVRPGALTGCATSQGLRPGEFSLAHGGLLVADEFPEWARDSREALREPLERGKVTLTRSKGSFEFPAQFALAANGNLCSCGGWPPEHPLPTETLEPSQARRKVPRCRCSLKVRNAYKARLSGPILDRMDLVLFVASQSSKAGRKSQEHRTVLELQQKVTHCREKVIDRWGKVPGLLGASEIEDLIRSRPVWGETLEGIPLNSLRARHKIARVALSLAAWDELSEPALGHFMEAASYRPERFGLCD